MNRLELTGRASTHVIDANDLGCALHRHALAPFRAMRDAARRAGIDLVAASAFRDFDRQRAIWNAKYRGERALLDAAGRPLPAASLDAAARVEAILRWTALPGASRHHWGTDLDVYDRSAVPADYRLRLEADEYAVAGVFGTLSTWLDRNMRRFGFYRPYASGTCGVGIEPWHLSYAPVARAATHSLDEATLAAALQGQGVLGEEEILRRLPEIHFRYVQAVDRPPRMRARWARLET